MELTGPQDPETGYVYDLKKLSQLIRKQIVSRYDHRNFNLDVEEFKTCIPTTENIARTIYERLRSCIVKKYSLSIVLYETEKKLCQI